MRMFCRSLFVLLCFFLFAIVLSVLRRFTDSHYPFGIFKLFFLNIYIYQEGNMANLCELCIAGDQITFLSII